MLLSDSHRYLPHMQHREIMYWCELTTLLVCPFATQFAFYSLLLNNQPTLLRRLVASLIKIDGVVVQLRLGIVVGCKVVQG